MNFLNRHILKIVFLVSFSYWIVLLFSAQMSIVTDAKSYELLAQAIKNNGWQYYFDTGPHREPLYPLTIVISMSLASWLGMSYQFIQTMFQILILAISQGLLLCLLDKLKIHRWIMAGTLFYFAISPSIVNTGFSLFSEVLTYPFMLVIILCLLHLFDCLKEKNISWMASLGWIGLCGCALLGLTFVRGVGMVLAYFIIVVMVVMALYQFCMKRFDRAQKLVIFSLLLAVMISIPIHLFKKTNLEHNGQYQMTNRTSWMLYGSARRRIEPLQTIDYVAGLLFAGGDGLCNQFMSKERCHYWSFYTSDTFGFEQYRHVEKKLVVEKKVNAEMRRLTLEAMSQHPFRHASVFGVDMLRHFFWESTKVGFVNYPAWLAAIYNNTAFKNILRLSISFTTIIAFFSMIIYLIQYRKNTKEVLYYYALIMIVFTLAYLFFVSFVTPLTRYAFPVVPFYLVFIALMFQRFLARR